MVQQNMIKPWGLGLFPSPPPRYMKLPQDICFLLQNHLVFQPRAKNTMINKSSLAQISTQIQFYLKKKKNHMLHFPGSDIISNKYFIICVQKYPDTVTICLWAEDYVYKKSRSLYTI